MQHERIGRYRVIGELGRGGMGVVYEAVHEALGNRVAVKLLGADGATERAIQRFQTEAQALAAVHHEGLVKIWDSGRLPDGTCYILMEYLEGESLGVRLARLREERRSMPIPTALHITAQVAAALEAVHQRGIIHRDIKPDNLKLVADPVAPGGERVKVLDFGVALFMDAAERHTREGEAPGTASYMAPEQCTGQRIDPQADVYALGVVLYEMLTGQPPFTGAWLTVMNLHCTRPPPPVRQFRPEVPERLEWLVQGMLEKARTARPSMGEVSLQARQLLALSGGVPQPAAVGVVNGGYPATRTRAQVGQAGPWQRRVRIGALLFGCALRADLAQSSLIYFPGGPFTMGSSEREIDAARAWCQELGLGSCERRRFEREGPARRVEVSPFVLDRNEVTNEQMAMFLEQLSRAGHVQFRHANRRVLDRHGLLLYDLFPTYQQGGVAFVEGHFQAVPGKERKPVVQVTWYGALRFCQARGMRLPYEAEWEYAARQRPPPEDRFPWGGGEPECAGVVFARASGMPCAGVAGPLPVGTARQDRTPQGVHDLGGNVAEWVMDDFEERYRECPEPCPDPRIVTGSPLRVVRGGDWNGPALACRSTGRSFREALAEKVPSEVGFRCAQDAPR